MVGTSEEGTGVSNVESAALLEESALDEKKLMEAGVSLLDGAGILDGVGVSLLDNENVSLGVLPDGDATTVDVSAVDTTVVGDG